MSRRPDTEVLVTGLGCVTALGRNTGAFWDGLLHGADGIVPITGFSREHLRNQCAGEILLDAELEERAARRRASSRLALWADLAAEEAIADSRLLPEDLRRQTTAVVLGVSLGTSLDGAGLAPVAATAGQTDDLSGVAAELAARFGIGGPAFVVSTACAAATNAIGLARDLILGGGCDVVVCGGADSLDRMKYLGHSALGTLSPSAIRPFDSRHDGTIFGEGAGMLVLEAGPPRGGTAPYARCSGAGFSCDARDVTAPDPSGGSAAHAIRQALADAGLAESDIDYVNLHGSGTVLNDAAECAALFDVFGPGAGSIPVSSTKAAIGHTMGAAGGCEAVATVLSVCHQRIPPTANVRERHPDYPVRLVFGQAMDCTIRHALSNSFGFGGCNGVVAFSRNPGDLARH